MISKVFLHSPFLKTIITPPTPPTPKRKGEEKKFRVFPPDLSSDEDRQQPNTGSGPVPQPAPSGTWPLYICSEVRGVASKDTLKSGCDPGPLQLSASLPKFFTCSSHLECLVTFAYLAFGIAEGTKPACSISSFLRRPSTPSRRS